MMARPTVVTRLPGSIAGQRALPCDATTDRQSIRERREARRDARDVAKRDRGPATGTACGREPCLRSRGRRRAERAHREQAEKRGCLRTTAIARASGVRAAKTTARWALSEIGIPIRRRCHRRSIARYTGATDVRPQRVQSRRVKNATRSNGEPGHVAGRIGLRGGPRGAAAAPEGSATRRQASGSSRPSAATPTRPRSYGLPFRGRERAG